MDMQALKLKLEAQLATIKSELDAINNALAVAAKYGGSKPKDTQDKLKFELQLSPTDKPSKDPNGRYFTNDDIRDVISSFSGEFTLANIRDALSIRSPGKEFKASQIPNVLHQLKNLQQIEIKQERAGNIGAIYVRT